MRNFLSNRMAYLTASFVLMLAALPLISIGTTIDVDTLWWTGVVTLFVGAAILPLQRLLAAPPPEKPEDESPD